VTNEERKLALRRHDQKDEWSKQNLKGQCHKIFDFRFFHESVFPQDPEYPIRVFLNFFENLWRYVLCIRSSRCTTAVVDPSGKWKKSSIIKVLIILSGHL
jgi:hypothetical protein